MLIDTDVSIWMTRGHTGVAAYTLSQGLPLGDALIAATALELGRVILTGNAKHFRSIDGLQIETFTP